MSKPRGWWLITGTRGKAWSVWNEPGEAEKYADTGDGERVVHVREVAQPPPPCEGCARLEDALRRAHSLLDDAMGDTDPADPDDPLLKACQAMMAALAAGKGE